MLHTLNAKERNQAFARFMGLFMITIIMVMIAVFFMIRVPHKVNTILTDQLENSRVREAEQQKFTAIVDAANELIDSLGKPGANDQYLKSMIGIKLKEMTIQSNQLSAYHDMNKTILTAFLNYCDVKNGLLDLKDAPKQIEAVRNELRQSEADRDQLRRDLDNIRKQANLGL